MEVKEKGESIWRRKTLFCGGEEEEEKYNEEEKIVAGRLNGWTGIEVSTRGPCGHIKI